MTIGPCKDVRQYWTAQDSRKHGFLAVPRRSIRDHGKAAKSLAALIAVSRMDGSRDVSRPQSTIAALAKISTDSVYRHCKLLESAGVISVRRRRDATNVVSILDNCLDDGFLACPRYALELPWTQCLVLSWLSWRAGLSHDGSHAETTYGAIAAALAIPRRSVIRTVGKLVESGFLERTEEKFKLLPPPNLGGDILRLPDVLKVVTFCGEGGDRLRDKEEPTKEYMVQRKKAVDRKFISKDVIAPRTASTLKRISYRGDSARNVWKITGAYELGLISANELHDSIEGTRLCKPRDKPAYFYAVLENHVRKRGIDLRKLLANVIVIPECPSSPPKVSNHQKPVREDRPSRTNEPTLVSEHLERWRLGEAA